VFLFVVECAQADILRDGPVLVEFESNDQALAEETLTVLTKALREFERPLPAGAAPIHVFVCGTRGAFAQFAGTYAQPDVMGVALPEKGIIALKDPKLGREPTDYRGTLRHELVHVLLARNTNPDNVPQWLNEGVAMVLSGEHRWDSVAHVAYMVMEGRIIEYRDLSLAFLEPGKELQFGDAYAQAYSMTQYLIGQLGEGEFWRLVRSLDTRTFGDALRAHLGRSPLEFWQDWVHSLWWFVLVFSIVSGLSLFQVMAILTVLAYLRKRRRGRRIVETWDTEASEPALGDDPGDPPL
jgi:hypothetical protein